MNRLEQVHELLEQTKLGDEAVYGEGVSGEVGSLKQFVPEVEPSRDVRIARHLNALLQELPRSSLSPETEHELYNLRNEFEAEAKDVVFERCEIDSMELANLKSYDAHDPVSKIRFSISESEYRQHDDPLKTAKHWLARAVMEP
ncbi:hypothetical protein M192_gp085 [Halorubrum tailed phage 8]|uniref:Uncharacterized protein n=3 Tax=Haloferacalesvirus TaxID=2843389 RepID=R4T598_9CAUD|nr:hypothetical protein M192_gp085 [Halorubrum tailed phage 8]UBF19119.1 hypothetical protein HRTV-14_gp46 [Halorubrum phage HRTV-14]UBF19246.1 hypothetical protein HRTV-17_gp47 [Halorubrum phage HRTV-17]UBF19373.1 hypothetical protein HRTV-19_gp47 [Halorubrum virus HRTV-19]UBF19502.1 hypothetical protein HRTV-23_gp47 [Halorubrum virus HRTV-23]AGM10794.1 hypothetical protein HRTV8_48 [Halorubrum tailed phage 8]